MARPTAFTRQTSFTQFSSNFPSKQQNGASLDAEFNAAKVALDETQSNLALIQDDDGALARGSVGRAQLGESITLGFSAPTAWAASTSYDADESTVFRSGKFYIAAETHTSTDTFDSTKWTEIADLSASTAIDDGSITEAKLASNAVTADKIQALAVTSAKIASAAVTNAKLATGAVTRTKVDDSAGPDLASLILPAGLGPIPWSGRTAPTGWVLTGGTYNRAEYPALWVHAAAEIASGINTLYGVGDGSTTFTIQATTGRALVGLDAAASVVGGLTTLGAVVGVKEVTLTAAELPSITLGFSGTPATINSQTTSSDVITSSSFGGINSGAGSSATGLSFGGTAKGQVASTASYTPDGIIESFGADGAHYNLQPSIAVNFIIKAH